MTGFSAQKITIKNFYEPLTGMKAKGMAVGAIVALKWEEDSALGYVRGDGQPDFIDLSKVDHAALLQSEGIPTAVIRGLEVPVSMQYDVVNEQWLKAQGIKDLGYKIPERITVAANEYGDGIALTQTDGVVDGAANLQGKSIALRGIFAGVNKPAIMVSAALGADRTARVACLTADGIYKLTVDRSLAKKCSSPIQIARATSPAIVTDLRVVANGKAGAHYILMESNGALDNTTAIYTISEGADGSLSTAESLNLGEVLPGSIKFATHSNGHAVVAWAGKAPSAMISTWRDNGPWTSPYTIKNGAIAPDLGINAVGDIVVTFKYAENPALVGTAIQPKGGSWIYEDLAFSDIKHVAAAVDDARCARVFMADGTKVVMLTKNIGGLHD